MREIPGAWAYEHKSAATQIARRRIDHRKRKADSNGRIHSITAFAEYLHTGVRRIVVDADHHSVLSLHRGSRSFPNIRPLRGQCGGREGEPQNE
jgi:hypothetical protein